jgi:GNAT superfamily N-acetyltransferase
MPGFAPARHEDLSAPGRLSQIIFRIARKLVRPFGDLSIEVVLERDLGMPIQTVTARADLMVREATEEDLEQIIRLYAGRPRDNYQMRMRRGEKCFIAFVGLEIAHVNWTCFRRGAALQGRPFIAGSGAVYGTDGFTVEAFRGQNIHAFVLGEMLRRAQKAGYRTFYGVARHDRRAAFPAHRQLGYRKAGKLLCLTPKNGKASWVWGPRRVRRFFAVSEDAI